MWEKIAITLVFFLLMQSVVTFADTSQSYKEDVALELNATYETDVVGEKPAIGITTLENNNIYVDKQENGNKYLRYVSENTEDFYIDYYVNMMEDNIIIEFDFMYENDADAIFDLTLTNSSWNLEQQVLSLKNDMGLYSIDGKIAAKLSVGKFYHIAAVINFANSTIDVYLDHDKCSSSVPFNKSFDDISMLRFRTSSIGNGTKPIYGIDNFRIYSKERPIFDMENAGCDVNIIDRTSANIALASKGMVEEYMEDTVALYTNQNTIAIDGVVAHLDKDNPDVKAIVKNDRTLVPVRFVSEALNAEVLWNAETQKVTISSDETNIKMTIGSTELDVNGNIINMDVAPEIILGRTMVPIRYIAEAFEKKVSYDKSGLIVIGDREGYFDFRDDLSIFRTLAGELVFDEISGQEMVNLIKERYPNNGHPRMFFNNEKLAKIRADIESNPIMADWRDKVVAFADTYLDAPLQQYDIYDGIRLLNICQNVERLVEVCAFAYLLTDDIRYADRAIDEMVNACKYPDWNPSHFLDPSEMMKGIAEGYDWLYHLLTPDERNLIKTSICEMGLKQALDDYNDNPDRVRTWKWTLCDVPENWNLVCNSSVIIAALAIGDEESEVAAEALDGALASLKKGVLMFAPDGAWHEGTMYWKYGTEHFIDAMSAMDTTFGYTFGLMEGPGVAQTGYYTAALAGSAGEFNFHDATTDFIDSSSLFFFADKLGDPGLANLRVTQMQERDWKGSLRDIIWYNPDVMNGELSLNKDYYYRDNEVVSMRSSWNDDESVFVGLHGGKINVTHGHMDAGTFIIDACGERFACDVGGTYYDLPVSVWDLYVYRAEGHNVCVINPDETGGQLPSGIAVMEKFESGENSAYAITDLTSAYKDNALSARRGIMLTNDRSMIIVQDEIKGRGEMDVFWFMHSEKDIKVSPDGRSARICGEKRDAIVKILGDVEGSFTVMDSVPLPTSPVNDYQRDLSPITKLVFNAKGTTDLTIPIAISFVLPGKEATNNIYPEVKKLDDWNLSDNISIELPKLTDLKVNGHTISDFSSDKYTYTYSMGESREIPEIEATANGIVDIVYPDVTPGNVFISVSSDNSGLKNHYMISLEYPVLSNAPDIGAKLEIKSVSASDVPQLENVPSNTIDNDISTRWSAQGTPSITYDLGEIKTLTHIGLAAYQNNDNRKQFFDVLVSDDGENFTTIYSGGTTGETVEQEYFVLPETETRYVRILSRGNSINSSWTSITEFSAYGK